MKYAMDAKNEKYLRLKEQLAGCKSMAVAFSGGVDSTFLLTAAYETLEEKAVAVTAAPAFVPPRELEEAAAFCRERGIRQIVIPAEELSIDSIRHNPPDRCYHCKKTIFGKILDIASHEGLAVVAEGSNVDDTGDYRPGMRALQELKICSPLLEAGLTKQEIRDLSRELGLPTWDKPSFACLASRFVYGEPITDEKLRMVDRAEQLLQDLGFGQYRVRIHGNLARIELLPTELQKATEEETRGKIASKLKEYGFSYVTLDLAGYRTGSMNEGLRSF